MWEFGCVGRACFCLSRAVCRDRFSRMAICLWRGKSRLFDRRLQAVLGKGP